MRVSAASLLPVPPVDGARPQACTADAHGPLTVDERIVGVALTVRWMLLTRRRLGQAPLFHDLDYAALIDFWADDHPSSLTR